MCVSPPPYAHVPTDRDLLIFFALRRFQWQCYVPTLALLTSQDLGLPITAIGWLYFAFVGMSIVSSTLLSAHLKYYSPFTLLWTGYTLRAVSGVLHVIGCAYAARVPTAMSLLIASRLVHGYTILLFPLSVVWIGAREAAEQRPSTLASRNAYSTVGIFGGILSGSALSAVMPTSLAAGAAPGYLNVLVSLLMLAWLNRSFDDRALLPSKPPPPPPSSQQQPSQQPQSVTATAAAAGDGVPWLHVRLVGFAQLSGWLGFVAIEGSLSLIVVESYGMTHADVIAVWGPTSLAMLLGTLLFSRLHKAKWRGSTIATVAIASLPMAAAGLVRAMGTQPPSSAYEFERSWVSIASFAGGLGALLFAFAVTNTLWNALLMQHLQPHQQAQFQTPVQTLAAVGRGIGPYLGTLIMAKGNEVHSGLGARLTVAMAYLAIALSVLVPSAFGARFFDPPKPVSMW